MSDLPPSDPLEVALSRSPAGPAAAFRSIPRLLREAMRPRAVRVLLVLVVCYGAIGPAGRGHIDWSAIFPAISSPLVLVALHFAWTALFGVLVPLVAVRATAGLRPKDVGMTLGDVRFGALVLAIGLPLMTAAIVLGARTTSLEGAYPLFAHVAGHPAPNPLPPGDFALYSLAYGFFFLGVETLHHGVITFGLCEIPVSARLALAALVHTIWHFGQPLPELIAAPIWAFVVGVIVLRARATWPAVLLHWVPNVVLDAVLTYG